jgi:hypothetical protein
LPDIGRSIRRRCRAIGSDWEVGVGDGGGDRNGGEEESSEHAEGVHGSVVCLFGGAVWCLYFSMLFLEN